MVSDSKQEYLVSTETRNIGKRVNDLEFPQANTINL